MLIMGRIISRAATVCTRSATITKITTIRDMMLRKVFEDLLGVVTRRPRCKDDARILAIVNNGRYTGSKNLSVCCMRVFYV